MTSTSPELWIGVMLAIAIPAALYAWNKATAAKVYTASSSSISRIVSLFPVEVTLSVSKDFDSGGKRADDERERDFTRVARAENKVSPLVYNTSLN